MKHRNADIAIATATIRPEGSELLNLEYTLFNVTGQEGEVLYALRVDKRSANGNLLEREETHGLTGSLEDATAMAKAFAAGTVPPCVLLEMVEEWEHPYFHTSREENTMP